MKQMQTPFGQWLTEKLDERGWIAADLTRASQTPDNPRGLDSGLISRWLRDGPLAATPTHAETLSRLAHAFRVPDSEVYRAAGRLPPDIPSNPIQSELEERLHHLGTILSKYPRAFWLAVIEASEHFAESTTPPPSPPVSATKPHVLNAPSRSLTTATSRRRKRLTDSQPAFVPVSLAA